MNNTQLETFLKIVETGSFTATANMLGYAQSTVTTQIKLLEEEVGFQIFYRNGKGAELTPAGSQGNRYSQDMAITKIENTCLEGKDLPCVFLGISEGVPKNS